MSAVTLDAIDDFDDPRLDAAAWAALARRSPDGTVFDTRAFKRAWWSSFGLNSALDCAPT